jgi:hypothetical protein
MRTQLNGRSMDASAMIDLPSPSDCEIQRAQLFVKVGESAAVSNYFSHADCTKPDTAGVRDESDAPDIVRVDATTGRFTALKKGRADIADAPRRVQGSLYIRVE